MRNKFNRTPDGFFFLQIWFLQIVRFPENMLRYVFTTKDFADGVFDFIGIGVGHYYLGLFIAGAREKVNIDDISQIE